MTIYGYARVSSEGQNLDRQIKQLEEVGVSQIYKEKLSGAKTDDRPKLQELLNNLKENDVIYVTDLTRITRSTQDLFSLINVIKEKNANLKSLKDSWLDLSEDNPYSQFLITVMAGVNQLERDLIRMRQKEGIELAKERGVYKGRPKKYTDKNQRLQHALELFAERDKNKKTVDQIAEITGVSRATIYREVRKADHN